MTQELELTFYTDPGHGWLAVPITLVRILGIQDIITGYSYYDERNGMAYLEEDCDASVFVKAAKREGWDFKFKENHTDALSFIRHLPYYPFNTDPQGYKEVLAS